MTQSFADLLTAAGLTTSRLADLLATYGAVERRGSVMDRLRRWRNGTSPATSEARAFLGLVIAVQSTARDIRPILQGLASDPEAVATLDGLDDKRSA